MLTPCHLERGGRFVATRSPSLESADLGVPVPDVGAKSRG